MQRCLLPRRRAATTVLTCEDERDRGTHEAEERRAGRAEIAHPGECERSGGGAELSQESDKERRAKGKLCSKKENFRGEGEVTVTGGALNRGTTAQSRERRCSPCFASTLHERSGKAAGSSRSHALGRAAAAAAAAAAADRNRASAAGIQACAAAAAAGRRIRRRQPSRGAASSRAAMDIHQA